MFYIPLKSKMAAKSGENWNFSPLHRTLLYYPVGQKIRSKSLYLVRFSRYSQFFLFSAKIQDGCQKWRKLKFFPLAWDTLVLPCGSKIHSKLLYLFTLSLVHWATVVKLKYVTVHKKVDEQHIWEKLCSCNTFEDISHLLIMVIIKNWQSSYYSLSYGDKFQTTDHV